MTSDLVAETGPSNGDPRTESGPEHTRARAGTGPIWVAGLVAAVALVPWIDGALGPCVAALVAIVWLTFRQRTDRWRKGGLPTLALLAVVVAACWPELRPLDATARTFSQGAAQVNASWEEFLAPLETAVTDTPLAGGDFAWADERQAELGERSGISILSSDARQTIHWSGWTTQLTPEEQEAIRDVTVARATVMVVRRGLKLRLLYAKRNPPSGLIVVAEKPLPREPEAGVLAPEGAALRARVRWDSMGEGVRAEVGEIADAQTVSFYSQNPLMSPDAQRKVGSVSLAAVSPEQIRAGQRAQRRGLVALATAAWMLWLVLSRAVGWWMLVFARLALVPLHGWLSTKGFGFVQWFDAWDGSWMTRLIATPLDAAASAMLVVSLIALCPLPERVPSLARLTMIATGLLAAAFGLRVVWRATTRAEIAPGEVVLLPFEQFGERALLVLALSGLVWAGLLLAGRAFEPRRRRSFVFAAIAAGAIAGAMHGQALNRAAERMVERELAAEVHDREEVWRRALIDTLAIAIPPADHPELAPERDAIDLWWRSPLGRLGLVSGVWKFEAGDPDRPIDAFLTGVPPVDIRSQLTIVDPQQRTGPFEIVRTEPERVRYTVISDSYELMTAEVQRPEGGSWIAGVLVEPGNLPSRARLDPLRGARAASGGALADPREPDGGLRAQLAWFDQSGGRIDSDLDAGPPAPRTTPLEPRWRTVSIEGQNARIYEMPDRVGTVTAVIFPLDLLGRSALAAGWGLLVLLAAIPWLLLRWVLFDTGAFMAGFSALMRGIVREFRVQLAVVLVVAGLLPLLALGGVGRAATLRQATIQLTADATRAVQIGRKLVEDYLSVEDEVLTQGTEESSQTVASWLSRTLGDDLFLWRDGELLATSRPDLVRAGLWPERLPSSLWRPIAIQRRPQLIEPFVLRANEREIVQTVAHGPYRLDGRGAGVLTIPLAGAEERFQQALTDFDRALLVSSLLLVSLALLLLIPTLRRLTTPLIELEQATAHIAAGEFDRPIPETGYEETRSLARAFQAMAVSLGEQRAALDRRRAAIEALIDSIPMAVLALSAEGVVRAANPQARRLLQTELGQTLPAANDPLLAAVVEVQRADSDLSRTVDLPVDDDDEDAGSKRFRVSGIELTGLIEGQPARLITIEDLTDALRSERLVAWAEMARRVAHEIKNPLTPINLMVDYVRKLADRDDPRLDEALDRCLTTISQQVRVLRDTAREFSDYARLAISRPETVDLPEVLREWLAPYLVVEDAPIRLQLAGPASMPSFAADPRLLRRAVINLVDNAREAIESGAGRGTITVSWSFESEPDRVLVIVEDDGPGIDPERLAQLFEPDVTTRETGSGLGLPIVREVVEAHGGRIDVDPRPGRGARFTLVLPASARSLAGDADG